MQYYQFLFIRTSFIYLLYTVLSGTALYIWPLLAGYFRSAHVHAGLVGFFLNMVMGVAFWMMPRPGGLRQKGLEAWTYFLLNLGLASRLLLEPWMLYSGNTSLRPWLVASALSQTAAIVVFVFAMSRRVLTTGMLQTLRERREKN